MNTNTEFIDKHLSQMPIKYVRKSIHDFLHKSNGPIDVEELAEIDKQFLEYIKVPRYKNQK